MYFLRTRNFIFKYLDDKINYKPEIYGTSRELRIKCQKQERRCRHKLLLPEIILSFPLPKIMVEYFNILVSFSEGLESNTFPEVVLSEVFCRLTQPLQLKSWDNLKLDMTAFFYMFDN
jgi:hypothetical protein